MKQGTLVIKMATLIHEKLEPGVEDLQHAYNNGVRDAISIAREHFDGKCHHPRKGMTEIGMWCPDCGRYDV